VTVSSEADPVASKSKVCSVRAGVPSPALPGQAKVYSAVSEKPGNRERRYRTPTISHRLWRSMRLPYWSTGSALNMNVPGSMKARSSRRPEA
jgi:hypothetical protein